MINLYKEERKSKMKEEYNVEQLITKIYEKYGGEQAEKLLEPLNGYLDKLDVILSGTLSEDALTKDFYKELYQKLKKILNE